MRFEKYFIPAVLVMVWAASAVFESSAAHRYHTSLTKIEYNPRSESAEITIDLFTHDLEKVLGRIAGKKIDIDKSDEADRVLQNYLRAHFEIKDKNGATLEPAWVGTESKADMTTVYMELAGARDFEGFTVKNTIFFETFREQTNLVTLKFGERKIDLLFKAGDKFKEVKAKK